MSKKYGTDQQQAAYNAGYGYGHGKANKRVQVQPENQAAFRDGVNSARSKFGKANKEKPRFSREDKIEYFTDRINDQSITQGQRNYAIKRLQQFAKSK